MNTETLEMFRQRMKVERYIVTSKLSKAMIDTICLLLPDFTHSIISDLFNEWLDEEEGKLAMDRLANLIIY